MEIFNLQITLRQINFGSPLPRSHFRKTFSSRFKILTTRHKNVLSAETIAMESNHIGEGTNALGNSLLSHLGAKV